MSEIENLLNELKNMREKANQSPTNSMDFWRRINNKDSFQDLGFTSEEELKAWILANPYANIS